MPFPADKPSSTGAWSAPAPFRGFSVPALGAVSQSAPLCAVGCIEIDLTLAAQVGFKELGRNGETIPGHIARCHRYKHNIAAPAISQSRLAHGSTWRR